MIAYKEGRKRRELLAKGKQIGVTTAALLKKDKNKKENKIKGNRITIIWKWYLIEWKLLHKRAEINGKEKEEFEKSV